MAVPPIPRSDHAQMIQRVFQSVKTPHVLLVLWLLFLAGALWWHVQRTQQPPSFDAFSYFQKGQNFWANFHRPKLENPFNLEPTFRPPGTVVMSYPFGFSKDFHGFYFRSVYLPILCLAIATYLAAYRRGAPRFHNWNLALMAMFLASLPTFYHFDAFTPNPSAMYFGLVDNFLGGVAALAAGAIVRSLRNLSLRWIATGASLGGFCLWVKPSGAFVMASLGVGWSLAMLALLAFDAYTDRQCLKRGLWRGLLLFAAIYTVFVLPTVLSHYLGRENFAYGQKAFQVLEFDYGFRGDYRTVLWFINSILGCVLPLSTIALWLLAVLHHKKGGEAGNTTDDRNGLFIFVLVCAAVGIWFWIYATGGTQVRYFIPFGLMAIIGSVPLLRLLEEPPRWTAAALRILWLLPVLNLSLLLLLPHPALEWQARSGMTLHINLPETSQALALKEEVQKNGKNAVVYSFDAATAASAFAGVSGYDAAINPNAPHFTVVFPVDWVRRSSYRLDEILSADYILFAPIRDVARKEQALSRPDVPDFYHQALLFSAWFTDLGNDEGVEVVSETSDRLLRIADPSKLELSLNQLLQRHSWPEPFLEANPKHWWTRKEMLRRLEADQPIIANVRFGELLKVEAVSLHQDGAQTKLLLWWDWLNKPPEKDWRLFIHTLDEQGSILAGQEISLGKRTPLSPQSPIQFNSVDLYPPSNGKVAAKFGMGVYRGEKSGNVLLTADQGVRDWGNSRVIIPAR